MLARKLVVGLCIFFAIFVSYYSSLISTASAQQIHGSPIQTDITTGKTISLEINAEVPKEIENNLKKSIKTIYGEDRTDEVYNNVINIIKSVKERRSLKLLQEDLNRSSDWYKDEIIYMFYAKDFGVKDANTPNTFNDDVKMLDYLKNLGVTTVYILPFMDSPMGDAGFDVRDPKNVRADLGGIAEFDNFAYEARKRGFKIKGDLILNHFSDQHKFFQEALKGNPDMLKYFVYTEEEPKYKKYQDPQKGVVIDYFEKNGAVSSRRLIFPDISESHYRKVNISGKDYYVYHTFYPFQPDINWKNPEVLYYVLEVMGYWANLGIDVFRVDAIPYFFKKEGTNSENLQETHEIVKLLSSYLQAVAPRSILLAEACQWPSDIVPYYGSEKKLPPKDLLLYMGKEYKIKLNKEKEITRSDEVQVGYHFPIMPGIWAALLTANNSQFWKAYENTPNIPNTTTWAIFLRVHDELTLEMIDIPTRKLIYDKLVSKGQEFRKGLGVSGRMANFLDKDPKKIELAFSILLSMPGIPIIYYGDEIGALNNFDYAKKEALLREENQKKINKDMKVISYYDSRDINRGPILKSDFDEAMENKNPYKSQIFQAVKKMIATRKESNAIRRGEFIKLNTDKTTILAYLRDTADEKLFIVHNLSDKEQTINVSLDNKLLSLIKGNKIKDLLTDKEVAITKLPKSIKLKMKPYEKLWLKL